MPSVETGRSLLASHPGRWSLFRFAACAPAAGQPLRRPGGSSRSLCSAQPRPMRLGLPAHPPRARVRAANQVNAAHCQCCRFSDLLSMTPSLAALTRRRRHHRSPELHRRPESANNNSAKQKWRRQPAAAAPPRRLEPVALLGAAAADAARPAGAPASRACKGSESG